MIAGLTVLDNGEPVAAVLSFFSGRSAALLRWRRFRARQRAGNDFMYWALMTRAASRGARLFDFGRSKFGTGSFAFKELGFRPHPTLSIFVAAGICHPRSQPLNPKYRILIRLEAPPLPLANLIGPAVVRGIG